MKEKNISIGMAQAMARHLKENGWAIKSGKMTSRDGVIADIKLDGSIDLSIEGSSSVKTIGPFSSLPEFRASLKSETMFNRFAELEDLEDNLKAWAELVHGYELRDKDEVIEFLKVVSPDYYHSLYQEFESWAGSYYSWVRKEDRFGETFPFSGYDLLSNLHRAMDGDNDWNINAAYDVEEALYGIERTQFRSFKDSLKYVQGAVSLDRWGLETIDCGKVGEMPSDDQMKLLLGK